ncbi:MAG: hypothetical protein OES47_13590 [Acidobacteriota bacterium]|nr:hypothetical protein [Acidobacteriota bacterium]
MSESGDLEDLERRLGEASEADLFDLVRSHINEINPRVARRLLRNPHVSQRVIEELLAEKRLLTAHEVRRELAEHPRTPVARSLDLLATLFWRDLVNMGADPRVPPRVRRFADQRLVQRLPGLAAGEKTVIARKAGAGLIVRLRHDPDIRVIAALLENPRLTEGLLGPLVVSESARPEVIELILRDRKWRHRYFLRVAAALNFRTPVTVALDLLPTLKKVDLGKIARDRRIAASVRRRADLLRGAARRNC